MSSSLTPDQLNQLSYLGLSPATSPVPSKKNIIPLLSISGLTIFSLGGLILLKSQPSNGSSLPVVAPSRQSEVGPTQVPKSIQHYLLASQQYFSQALALQSSDPARQRASEQINLLNQSILAASEAVKSFPADYRGWQQRAGIYQSLLDSQPQLLNQALADYSTAFKLNPASAEISRALAFVYAKKGDTQNTLAYLSQTVVLEPTRAQNFYDLAKLQQQVGLIPQALNTYSQLLPLITDQSQLAQLKSVQSTLEKIIAQNPASVRAPLVGAPSPELPNPSHSIGRVQDPPLHESPPALNLNSPTLQASAGTGLIIAAPESSRNISVSTQTNSNSLSGTATIPASSTSLTIKNSHLTSTSKVYLTITKADKNQSLTLTNKTATDFSVSLTSPSTQATEFNWWIVN